MTPAFTLPVVLASLVLAATHASRTQAQEPATADSSAQAAALPPDAAVVPWTVGERLDYEVRLGPIGGNGYMEVRGTETVRGVPTYHTVFQVKGGIPLFRVNSVFESWIGVRDLASYRFVQDQDEGPNERERRYEIYPDRQVYKETVKGGGEERPSVANPLDDGSFLYFLRTVPLEVGKTYVFNNYFRPERNPVTIRVVRAETIRVPAGTFETVVLQPMIKTKGIFSENGRAEVWLSNDDRRMMVQMKSRLSIGTLTLRLKQARAGATPTATGAGSLDTPRRTSRRSAPSPSSAAPTRCGPKSSPPPRAAIARSAPSSPRSPTCSSRATSCTWWTPSSRRTARGAAWW